MAKQLPVTHCEVESQANPHRPQFALLVLRFTQLVPQRVCPVGQAPVPPPPPPVPLSGVEGAPQADSTEHISTTRAARVGLTVLSMTPFHSSWHWTLSAGLCLRARAVRAPPREIGDAGEAMELWLVDVDGELSEAWEREFAGLDNVFVRKGDILSMAQNTLVSPANSYGWMDDGIDALYTSYFGLQLQARLQRDIDEQREGKLAVGAALLVPTGDQRIPWLISAPTMENPGPVSPENAFFAMSAALKLAAKHPERVSRLFCPGLGTGVGGVDPREAAREMANAYRKWLRS